MSFYFAFTRWTLFDCQVHRPGQLPPVLLRAGAAQRPVAHRRLRGRHQRPEGRARHAPGGPADLQHPGTRPAAVGRVLSRPRQHRRGRHHLQRAAGARHRPGRHRSEVVRDHRTGLARLTHDGAVVGRPGRRLEGRRDWPRSSTSPASCRSRSSTTRPSTSTAAVPGRSSGTSPSRCPGRRRSRSSCCRSSAAFVRSTSSGP